jgi:4'-phosphopantetheinyl transferase
MINVVKVWRGFMEVYACKISDIAENTYLRMLSTVSIEKKKKLSKFIRKKDVLRSLLGEWLLRWAMCKKHSIDNSQIKIRRGEYGKPFLQNNIIHFNISHSEEWVICAISDSPIGIDIEKIVPINTEIGKRFFSKKEYLELFKKKDEKEKLEYFYRIWTLKESFIKAEGLGLVTHLCLLKLLTFEISSCRITLNCKKNETLFKFFWQGHFDNSYIIAIASLKPFYPKINVIDIFEMKEFSCTEM